MRFLLLFILVLPLLELWLLIRVGSAIGGLTTIALVIFTAIAGLFLLRRQSLATVLRARSKLEQGEAPAGELVEGVFLAVGGILLLIPGFITDAIGLCCLLPGLRRGIVGWVLRQAAGRGVVVTQRARRRSSQADSSQTDSHTIEGEYHREDEPRK